MGLMGSIYLGTSGLQTSQNALNTTAHNLSNMDTQGFVRQQVLLGDRIYNTIKSATPSTSSQQVGLGVTYDRVRQVRDYFLDQSYRRENGRASFYSTSYEAMREVEDLLDELNDDASFNHAMTSFWSTLQELAKTPDDTTVQRMLVQNAQSFLTNASQVYQGLIDYQNELNTHIKEKVDRINELGEKILRLNDEIRKVEAGGIENANDLRDARNLAIDELSGLVNISTSEDIYGAVRIKVEGVDFVAPDTLYRMGTSIDTQTGFYTPYWEINSQVKKNSEGVEYIDITGAEVFNTSQIISSEGFTDIGQLRAMLYARGDKIADFTDIPQKPVQPDPRDYALGTADPAYITDVAKYQFDLNAYGEKVNYYNHTVAQSVCMNIQAEFDQLIHSVVTTVNGIMYDAWKAHNGEYMADDDGSPLQLFLKKESEGFVKNGAGDWEEVPENIEDDFYSDTLYSIPNLIINPVLLREAGKMKFKLPDNTVDYDTAKKLIDAFDSQIYSLNPNVTTKCSLNTYYTNLVSQVANSGAVYKNLTTAQQTTVSSIEHAREEIVGVSSDEELTYMIKFQNAFNAASRYINVIDNMLEHIINSLG